MNSSTYFNNLKVVSINKRKQTFCMQCLFYLFAVNERILKYVIILYFEGYFTSRTINCLYKFRHFATILKILPVLPSNSFAAKYN
jgi:hypothetical protein